MRAFIFDLDGTLVDTVHASEELLPAGAFRIYRDPRESLDSLDELGIPGGEPR